MKKEDLKTGMIVVYRKGSKAKVMKGAEGGDALIEECGSILSLSKISDDLTYVGGYTFSELVLDIVEVYQYQARYDMLDYALANYDLIWNRTEKVPVAIREIEEKLGYEVEVVSE